MAASPKTRHDALMARDVWVRGHAVRWLCSLVLLLIATAAPATASAASPGVSDQAVAGVTEATTGLPDPSSLAPVDVCPAPEPGYASCLTQFLARRGTRDAVHPRLQRASSPNRVIHRHARTHAGASPLAVLAQAPPQAGTPAYLQQAYDLSSLSQTWGSDRTIAVVDAYDDPNAEADMAVYRSKFQLPACTKASGCFKQVSPPRQPPVGTTQDQLYQWRLEVSVDLQAASALCPRCHIVLVEAATDRSIDLANAQARAASLNPTPDVISDSFGAPLQKAGDDAFFGNNGQFTFPGIATVAASGDAGYPANDPKTGDCATKTQTTPCSEYPAALSGVSAVGGTKLAPAQGARGFGESAWSESGSGCNTDASTPKPAWQTGIPCAGRAYSDISTDADPTTGIQVYDSSPLPGKTTAAGWVVVGGSSAAAPMVAGYYALVESATAGAIDSQLDSPEWPYDQAAKKLLNDPATGSNGSCPALSIICNGMPGYDGPTGAGSISGAVVKGAPGIGGPGPTGTYTTSVGSGSALLRGGVYTNGNATSYWWEFGTTTAYGHQTSPVSINAGTAPVPVSSALTGLGPSTTYHYRLVASNSVGTTYGYDFTLKTAAAPSPSVVTGNGGSSPAGGTTTQPNPTSSSGESTNHNPISRPTLPTLSRLRILSLGAATATATATITTGGASTTYYLGYGTSRKLGRRAGTGSTTTTRTVTWHLRGLAAGKVYYLQVVAVNAAGTRLGALVRLRTSPVSVMKITRVGGKLAVLLRCRGSAPCRGHLAAKASGRVIAAGSFKIRGHRRTAVTLRLNSAALSRAGHGKRLAATLSASSRYNGYTASVAAKFRLPAQS
jgi:hypothetical protein